MQQTVKQANIASGNLRRFDFKNNSTYYTNIGTVSSMICVVLDFDKYKWVPIVIVKPLALKIDDDWYTYVDCIKYKTGETLDDRCFAISKYPYHHIEAVHSIQIDNAVRELAQKYAALYKTKTNLETFDPVGYARKLDEKFAACYKFSKKSTTTKKDVKMDIVQFTKMMSELGQRYKDKKTAIQYDSDLLTKDSVLIYWRECVEEEVEDVAYPCEGELCYEALIADYDETYTYDNADVMRILKSARIYGVFLQLCERMAWLKQNCNADIVVSIGFSKQYTDEPKNVSLSKWDLKEKEYDENDWLFNVYLVMQISVFNVSAKTNLKPLFVTVRECLMQYSR